MLPRPTGRRPSRCPLPGVRAVLFDVYGTLLVSGVGDIGGVTGRDARAFAAAAKSVGLEIRPQDARIGASLLGDVVREMHGRFERRGVSYPEVDIELVWREVLRRLTDQRRLAGAFDGPTVRRLAVEYECRVNPTWPMPGAAGVLRVLRRRGIKLGVVSNAQFFTPLLFDAFFRGGVRGLGFHPSLCLWSYRVREAKPSLFPVAKALEQLKSRWGIRPDQTLVVGNDLKKDLAPAARCGCLTALFAGDRRSLKPHAHDPALRRFESDAVVTDLRQLPPLLGSAE